MPIYYYALIEPFHEIIHNFTQDNWNDSPNFTPNEIFKVLSDFQFNIHPIL